MVKEENISFFSQMNWQSQRFEDIISIKTLLYFLLAAFSKLKALGSSSQVFFSAVHLLPILLDLSKDNCKLQLETANADCWAFDSTPPNPSTPSYRIVESLSCDPRSRFAFCRRKSGDGTAYEWFPGDRHWWGHLITLSTELSPTVKLKFRTCGNFKCFRSILDYTLNQVGWS